MQRGCLFQHLLVPQRISIAVQMHSPLLSKLQQKDEIFFYKEHYPSMRLVEENGRYYIHGFYNVGEETFIADYFIHYGDAVCGVEPMALRAAIRTRLRTLTAHYKGRA